MTTRWLLACWLLALPAAAAAHGESHGAATPVEAAATVSLQGYQVELSTHPGPLVVGRETHLIAKVLTGSAPRPPRRVESASRSGRPALLESRGQRRRRRGPGATASR